MVAGLTAGFGGCFLGLWLGLGAVCWGCGICGWVWGVVGLTAGFGAVC